MVYHGSIAPITVPIIGNTAAQGATFQTHLSVVSFVMGASILAVVYEGFGAHSAEHQRFARDIAHAITDLFAFGATWAVFALVFLFGLYPDLFQSLVRIFFWPWVVIVILWVTFTVLAYVYSYGWERLHHRRRLHLTVGAAYAFTQFVFVVFITTLSSYQLTPADPHNLFASWNNATWAAEWTHRHIAVLSYAGFFIGAFAAYRVIHPKKEEDRGYYGWVEHQGIMWAVILLLLQPAASGWAYVFMVQAGSPGAFKNMMVGQFAFLFLIQTGILFALFLATDIYMWRAMARSGVRRRGTAHMKWAVVAVAAFAVLALLPKGSPGGAMFPWKTLAIAVLVAATIFIVVMYFRSRKQLTFVHRAGIPELALLAASALSLGMIIIMGVIRESARGGELIFGVMK